LKKSLICLHEREYGLVLRQGLATKKILGPGGYHFILPFIERVSRYPSGELTYMVVENKLYDTVVKAKAKESFFIGHSLDITTSDNITACLLFTIRFRINKASLASIHERFGASSIEGLIRDESRHIIRNTLKAKGYGVYDLLGTFITQVESDIAERLKERLAENGFEMTHFGLREPDLGELGKKLQEQMQAREQTKLEQENFKRQEEIAKRKRAKAENNAEILHNKRIKAAQTDLEVELIKSEKELTEAKSQAEIARIEKEQEFENIVKQAKAQAEANLIISSSLTNEIEKWHKIQAQIQFIHQWDGKMPLLSGQNIATFLELNPFEKTNIV
jgi:regulator of protease activity HflC (stomatin/prohibitin superfamily)